LDVFIAGSEHAHAKPKALYRQTNKQETGFSYMKSMLKRDEVSYVSYAATCNP
jgi:hypothetical protein